MVPLPWIFPGFPAHQQLSPLPLLFGRACLGPLMELCLVIFALFSIASSQHCCSVLDMENTASTILCFAESGTREKETERQRPQSPAGYQFSFLFWKSRKQRSCCLVLFHRGTLPGLGAQLQHHPNCSPRLPGRSPSTPISAATV